jgi:hypothetical protein
MYNVHNDSNLYLGALNWNSIYQNNNVNSKICLFYSDIFLIINDYVSKFTLLNHYNIISLIINHYCLAMNTLLKKINYNI